MLRNDLQQDIDLPYHIWNHDHRLTVLEWARDVVTTHDTVVKLPLAEKKSDILESIAQYAAGTPQEIRTLRQLIDRLTAFIAEVPFVEEEDMNKHTRDFRRRLIRQIIWAGLFLLAVQPCGCFIFILLKADGTTIELGILQLRIVPGTIGG